MNFTDTDRFGGRGETLIFEDPCPPKATDTEKQKRIISAALNTFAIKTPPFLIVLSKVFKQNT